MVYITFGLEANQNREADDKQDPPFCGQEYLCIKTENNLSWHRPECALPFHNTHNILRMEIFEIQTQNK